MIKGEGHLSNYRNLVADLDYITSKHPLLFSSYRKILKSHEEYKGIYRFCPIRKKPSFSLLPQTYKAIRSTLIKYYYDEHRSNFCCYCGKNEPERLDHFHPSSLSPQFSVLRFNLIRCCVRCNEIKSNHKPISKLKLKHPYLDKLYKKHELLFTVELKDFLKNNENEIIFDIDVIPQKSLSKTNFSDVNVGLRALRINESVGSRVSIQLTNICHHWNIYKGSVLERKNFFKALATASLSTKNYSDYFCYNILSSALTIRRIDKLVHRR